MNFKNYLQRANLDSIQNFLKYGSESFIETDMRTYSERIKDARKNTVNFFKDRFTDINEFDKILGYFEEQTTVYEEVYFEIGMILGAKIALELTKKAEELK